MAAMARTVTEMPLDELPVGAPWGTMPPELLRAIASRLPQRDLRSARSTCTSWLCMVQGLEQKAWEVSGPDLSDVEGWAQDVAALSALAPNIHHVQLTLAAMGALQLDRWLVTLQRNMKRLTTLQLSFQPCSGLQPTMLYSLAGLPALTSLSIKSNSTSAAASTLLAAVGRLTQLTALALGLRCFSQEPQELPLTLLAPLRGLRAVVLSKRHDYGSAYLALPWSRAEARVLAGAWTGLEELSLTLNVLDFYRPGLNALTLFTRLTTVRLSAVEGFAQLEWVWLNLLLLPPTLETLHIEGMVIDLPASTHSDNSSEASTSAAAAAAAAAASEEYAQGSSSSSGGVAGGSTTSVTAAAVEGPLQEMDLPMWAESHPAPSVQIWLDPTPAAEGSAVAEHRSPAAGVRAFGIQYAALEVPSSPLQGPVAGGSSSGGTNWPGISAADASNQAQDVRDGQQQLQWPHHQHHQRPQQQQQKWRARSSDAGFVCSCCQSLCFNMEAGTTPHPRSSSVGAAAAGGSCAWCREAVRPTATTCRDGRQYYMPPEYKVLPTTTCTCSNQDVWHHRDQQQEGVAASTRGKMCQDCWDQQHGTVAVGSRSVPRDGHAAAVFGTSTAGGQQQWPNSSSSSSSSSGSSSSGGSSSYGGRDGAGCSSATTACRLVTQPTQAVQQQAACTPGPQLRDLQLDSCRLSDGQLLTLAHRMGHCLRNLGLKHVRGLSDSGLVAALPHLVVLEGLEVMTVSAAGAGLTGNPSSTNSTSNNSSSSLTLGGLWDALSVRSRSSTHRRFGIERGSSSSGGSSGMGDSSSTDVLRPRPLQGDTHPQDQHSPQQQGHHPQEQQQGAPDNARQLPLQLKQLLWTCDAWTLELSSAARVQEELDKHLQGQARPQA